MYALIDCNNFYVSCERVFNPHIRNKPVVILSNNDGCIVSRSNEIKKLGIPMGAPYFKYKKKIKELGAGVFSSNYELYGDMSRRVMEVLSSFGERMEIYSIDEAFMMFTGYSNVELEELGRLIRLTILTHVGIPVSVGFGKTKTRAKMASVMAKKLSTSEGVYVLDEDLVIKKVFQEFDVGDIWGIGRKHKAFLNKQGVSTVADFLRLNESWVRGKMSVIGLRTWQELQGHVCSSIEQSIPPKQAIASTRSFGRPVTTIIELREAVAQYVSRASVKLRKQNSVCHYIHVFVMTSRFQSDCYFGSRGTPLETGTSYTPDILKQAHLLLDSLFREGNQYKKAGILLSGITKDPLVQRSLFGSEIDREKQDRAMEVIDKINKLYGNNSIQIGSVGVDKRWEMNADYRSKRFTTKWKDLLCVGN